jgi:aspartate-semialdehyde dehydrogenase
MPETKIPVAILAATGSVGQRFVQLLDGHPWFQVAALTGSDRAVGQTYGQACHWLLPTPMPAWAKEMTLLPSEPSAVAASLAFSALPPESALQVEMDFARSGKWICSNASAHRADADVPLLLPEVNPDHLGLIEIQQRSRGWSGGILTNPNCAITGVTVVFKALLDAFGVRRAFITTLQSISGAGYPGVASMDIIDNVVPYIKNEEEKVEWEPRKMLGTLGDTEIILADMRLSSSVHRVPVQDGHLATVFVELGQKATPEQAAEVLSAYLPPAMAQDLPSTPHPVILVRPENDRPQPRLDRMTGGGMTTVVGRLRPDPIFDLRMVILSHNTIRGAAGASIYNAELLVRSGYLPV